MSPTTAAHVRADLGTAVDLVLDGGASAVGLESTIVDCTADVPMVLRHGGVTVDQLRATIAGPVTEVAAGPSRAPGMLDSHYAPHAAVELAPDGATARRRQAMMQAEGRVAGVLDPGPDVAGYAHHLYEWLRDADAQGLDVLIVVPPPDVGLGAAVNERLRKAAAPRPR